MQETVEDGCAVAFEPTPGDLTDGDDAGQINTPHPVACAAAID